MRAEYALDSGPTRAVPWRLVRSDEHAREEAISGNLFLVRLAAGRLAMRLPPQTDPEDCYGAGVIALIRAVGSYEPERGIPFEPYAYPRIFGAMIDHLRAEDWVSRGARKMSRRLVQAYADLWRGGRPPTREEIAAHLSMSVKRLESAMKKCSTAMVSLEALPENQPPGGPAPDLVPESNVPDPGREAETAELIQLATRAVSALPERERTVIVLHYYEGLMLKEVAQVLKRSKPRVSQLHARALLLLRAALEKAPQLGRTGRAY